MWKKKKSSLKAPQKYTVCWIWPAGHSLPTPDLEYSVTLKVQLQIILQIILHIHLQSSLDICSLFLSCSFRPDFWLLLRLVMKTSPFYFVTPQDKSSLHSPLQTNLFSITNKSLVPRLDLPLDSTYLSFCPCSMPNIRAVQPMSRPYLSATINLHQETLMCMFLFFLS